MIRFDDIDPTEIDADVAYVASHGLDPQIAVKGWPTKAHLDWWSKYHHRMDEIQRAKQAA